MLRAVFVAQRVKFRALNQTDPRIANYKWNSLFVEPKGKKYISLRACFVFYNEPDKSHWVIQNKETKALPNIPGWQAIVSEYSNTHTLTITLYNFRNKNVCMQLYLNFWFAFMIVTICIGTATGMFYET